MCGFVPIAFVLVVTCAACGDSVGSDDAAIVSRPPGDAGLDGAAGTRAPPPPVNAGDGGGGGVPREAGALGDDDGGNGDGAVGGPGGPGGASDDGGADGGAGDGGGGTANVSDCESSCVDNYTTCYENRCDGEPGCVEERLARCVMVCEAAPRIPTACEPEQRAWWKCVFAGRAGDDCPIDPCDFESEAVALCVSGGRGCYGMTRWSYDAFDAFADGDGLGRVWQSACACPSWKGGGEGDACGLDVLEDLPGPNDGGDCASHCCECEDSPNSYAVSACNALQCTDPTVLCDEALASIPTLCGNP